MAKYRKKPVEVEAMQFSDDTKNQCFNFVRGSCAADFEGDQPIMKVQTIHGDTAVVRVGDWIVSEGMPGHYYPVKPDIFEQTYEPVT